MGRGDSLHKLGSAPRLVVPQGESVDVLRHIAMRELYYELQGAASCAWPQILAERQVSTYHVTALGKAVGLRLRKSDLAKLREVAAAALDEHGLSSASTMPRLVDTTGMAMRDAVARELAVRCVRGGGQLEHRVTDGRLPDPSLPSLDEDDWHELIVEKWRVLPFARTATITAFLRARLETKLSESGLRDPRQPRPVEPLQKLIAA